MQLLPNALTLDVGLDWALPCLLTPPRARGVYCLAYMILVTRSKQGITASFVFEVLKYSYS